MLILVPWFGNVGRFEAMADAWVARYVESGTVAPWRYLTDVDLPARTGAMIDRYDLAGFSEVIRPGQPFDVKGALVCAALLAHDEPLLVLDLDAQLLRDPAPDLAPFMGRVIAMPVDAGAITHDRSPRLNPPYGTVLKLCAGVMFFGAGDRGRLVAAYRKAWTELRPTLPWSPPLPHLLEQHAWSLAARRRGGDVLSQAFNWSPDHLGANALATVEHRYGLRKWRG